MLITGPLLTICLYGASFHTHLLKRFLRFRLHVVLRSFYLPLSSLACPSGIIWRKKKAALWQCLLLNILAHSQLLYPVTQWAYLPTGFRKGSVWFVICHVSQNVSFVKVGDFFFVDKTYQILAWKTNWIMTVIFYHRKKISRYVPQCPVGLTSSFTFTVITPPPPKYSH